MILGHLGAAYAAAGKRADAEDVSRSSRRESARQYVPSTAMATIAAALGDRGRALGLLEKAFDEHDFAISQIGVAPWFTIAARRAAVRQADRETGVAESKQAVIEQNKLDLNCRTRKKLPDFRPAPRTFYSSGYPAWPGSLPSILTILPPLRRGGGRGDERHRARRAAHLIQRHLRRVHDAWTGGRVGAEHLADPMLAELCLTHLADVPHGRVALARDGRADQQRHAHARGPELAIAEQQPSQFGERQVVDGHGGIDDDRHVAVTGLTRGRARSPARTSDKRHQAHGDGR